MPTARCASAAVTPGEIAAIPKGRALLVRGASSAQIQTTPYYARDPWRAVAADAPGYAANAGATATQRAA